MAKPIKTVQTVVTAVDEPAKGVKRLVLADPEKWELPPFRPGAHIDLHLAKGLVRTYSLCNEPADNRHYEIAVKCEADGRGGSRFVHEELRVGTPLGVSLPRGGLKTHDQAMNVFIAGGIGVTPFVSAIRDLREKGQTNYVLHWASSGHPALPGMVADAFADGRVHLYNTAIEPRPSLAAILKQYGDEAVAFCCGPTSMLDAFDAATASWLAERKHVERFPPPAFARDDNAAPYTLVLAQSKKEIVVRPEIGLVGALEELEADVSVSCAGGICGSCRTRWLEGPPIHNDSVLSPMQRQHEVMVCVAGCAGPRLVLDI